VRQQAEGGERSSPDGKPGRQLDACPFRVQPRPQYRGSRHFADHVNGGERGAQRIPAGTPANQEDERDGRHRDRKPGTDGDERPVHRRSRGELPVTRLRVTPHALRRAASSSKPPAPRFSRPIVVDTDSVINGVFAR